MFKFDCSNTFYIKFALWRPMSWCFSTRARFQKRSTLDRLRYDPWSADRIPQTPITIGSWDRENMKPNSLLPIESWHKSFTGIFRIEITWSWLNEKRQMISIHDVTMGGMAASFMSADTRASWPVQCTHTLFPHDTTRFGHVIFDRYVYVINVIENIQTVDTRQTMFQ